MSKLSLSRAWEETRAVLSRDGRLFASVALALVVLPQTLIGLLAPATSGEPSSLTLALLGVTILIGFIVQVSLNRLAIGPSTTVGAAIARGFTRMPALLGSFIILTIGIFILLIPIVLVLGLVGAISTPSGNNEAPAGLIVLMLTLVALCYAIFQLAIPIAAAETGGSIHLLARSWQLARGAYLRLLAFVTLMFLSLAILVAAGQFAIGSIIVTTLGPPSALSLSALILALVTSLIQAAVTVVFAVMLARIYVQRSAGDAGRVSVPRSGT